MITSTFDAHVPDGDQWRCHRRELVASFRLRPLLFAPFCSGSRLMTNCFAPW